MNRIKQAFKSIPRDKFVPKQYKLMAGVDSALSIGHGQTISQPTTVRMMLEWLNPHEGDKVLDVGSGSGWTAALLSFLVGPKGKVYAVERIPELLKFGKKNCDKLKINNVEFHAVKDEFGLPEHAPYDRILVSAAATEIPTTLLNQLAKGGKMVIPINYTIYEIEKSKAGEITQTPHEGFIFVPLIG
jgi:protein-L-isoaspartate(D-aspartate) O-methyltransferase